MSGGPSLFVPSAIAREAKQLIVKGAGDSVRQGVELLLKNDLKDVGGNVSGSVDAGSDLQKGLAILANSPFDALGVDVLAGTVDIRKAYKKMALKYHPDKNPNTTPLFQAIQCASEKLSDRGVRRQEASRYKPTKPPVPTQSPKNKPAGGNFSNYSNNNNNNYSQYRGSTNTNSEYEKKRQHEEKKAAWRNKCERERQAAEQKRREEEARRQQQAKNGYANFNDWDSPEKRRQHAQHQHRYANQAHPQKYDAYGRGYSFNNAQQQARDREEARQRKEQEKTKKFKGDRTFRREGMEKEAAAARARMEARRAGKASSSSSSSSSSAAAAREYMESYAQRKQQEQVEKLREQRRRQEEAERQRKPKKLALPRPTGLVGKVVDQNSVQLEWTKVSYSLATLHVELAYRGGALLPSGAMPDLSTTSWEVANTLIAGDKVRKKNLHLQYCYEFRIRYMVASPSGKKTQDVGEWCQPVRNILLSKQQQQASSRTKSTYSQGGYSGNKNSYTREKYTKKTGDGYSKFYDEDDYFQDHNAPQNRKHNQQAHKKPYDPYAFEDDDEDDIVDESYVYDDKHGYRYRDSAASKGSKSYGEKAKSQQQQQKKQQQQNKKKNKPTLSSLDEADEEVDEDPELTNILSQSARMAWKWGGGKGKAGVPEKEEDFYRRRMSRGSPPPEEVDEDGNYGDDFEDEEAQQDAYNTVYYTLNPPPAHNRGHYIHTVYAENDRSYRDNPRLTDAKKQKMLRVLGFLSSESYVLVNPAFSQNPMGTHKPDEWLYCQVHWKKKSPTDNLTSKFNRHHVAKDDDEDLPWGWAKMSHRTRSDNHQFLVPYNEEEEEEEIEDEEEEEEEEEGYDSFNADFAGFGATRQRKGDPSVDVWYEQVDDLGNPYFYNNKTGESRWESPEWVEETDEASGASYFVKLNKNDASPLNSTWSKPGQFARLVRQSSGQC